MYAPEARRNDGNAHLVGKLIGAAADHLHRVPDVVAESGLTENGWVAVDRDTLMTPFPDVYAVGDIVGIPMAKAGVFAENAAGVVADNIIARHRGETVERRYEGEGNCYLEFGGGRVAKVEANFLGGPAPTAACPSTLSPATTPPARCWPRRVGRSSPAARG